jgi:PAS domain S-box-containing protein
MDSSFNTELVHTEENTLQEINEACPFCYGAVRAGIVVYNSKGVIIDANKAAGEILDISPQDLLGQTLLDPEWGMRREDGSSFSDEDFPVHVVFRSGRPEQNVVVGILTRNSKLRRWLHFNAEPVMDQQTGKVKEVVTTFWNITGRKLAEERFRGLLESAPDALVIVDTKGRIVLVNSQTEKMFGYQRDELLDQSVEILVPERFREKHVGHRTGYYSQPRTRPMGVGMYLAGRRKDGSEFPVEISLSPLETIEGLLVTASVRDITDKAKAQEEIQALNEDLKRSTLQLEAANKELESFAYSVSHDLRAPLRSIDGFSQALLEDYADKLDEEGKDYLQRVRAASQRMAQLIDDILKLSRVTRSEMRHEPVDLSAMAQSIADELQKSEPDRQVQWAIQPGINVVGDSHLLHIMLDNLLNNAWKFTRGRSVAKIELGVTQQDDEPVYYVRDNGAGFDMTYVDKLFGAFQRLHSASEFPGTGIGLATVHRIAHRHGGRAWAEGEPDKGAVFYFTLPKP